MSSELNEFKSHLLLLLLTNFRAEPNLHRLKMNLELNESTAAALRLINELKRTENGLELNQNRTVAAVFILGAEMNLN